MVNCFVPRTAGNDKGIIIQYDITKEIKERIWDSYYTHATRLLTQSERMIYESALDRFIHEYAAANKMSVADASVKVKELLEITRELQDAA